MKITSLSENIKIIFGRCLIANELGNQLGLIYKFSDADGVRTGKSGWSFGVVQYDISNNPSAVLALREMGFTTDEIRGLKDQTIDDMAPMNAKLDSHKSIVNKWDAKQIQECLSFPLGLCNEIGLDFLNEEAFLHIADYHNQFYMSRGGKLYNYLKEKNTTITPQMIKDFKLKLPWGKKRPDDVERRFKTISDLCKWV